MIHRTYLEAFIFVLVAGSGPFVGRKPASRRAWERFDRPRRPGRLDDRRAGGSP